MSGTTVKKHRKTTKLRQTVLLGDRVIIKGERSGIVKYIGKLEGASPPRQANDVFVGIHLDQPIGLHNGTYQGRRFFTCPARHGAFLSVNDVVCVVNRQELPSELPFGRKKPSRLAKLKEENERLHSAAERKREEQTELEAELAEMQARLDHPGLDATEKPRRSSELPYYSEADLDAEIAQFRKKRPTSSMSEDSDLVLMKSKIDSLVSKGRQFAEESATEVDKHTIEEAIRNVIELADPTKSGLIHAQDFVYLLNSQALCMNLDDTEINLLLERIHVPPDNTINYKLVLPTLLDTLQTIKNQVYSTPGPHDRCNVYLKASNASFLYDLRTGAVRPADTTPANVSADTESIEKTIETVFLEAFRVQDPTRSGFVSSARFIDVLKSLHFELTDSQAELVLAKFGPQRADASLGVPYLNHAGLIRRHVAEAIRETTSYETDAWSPVYYSRAGLFYLNKRTGCLQTTRPSGPIV